MMQYLTLSLLISSSGPKSSVTDRHPCGYIISDMVVTAYTNQIYQTLYLECILKHGPNSAIIYTTMLHTI